MQEFDLQSMWDDANTAADDWYQRQREQLLTQARQSSAHILQKLRRQFMGETALSVVLGGVLIAWLYQPASWIFWGVICFWVASLVLVGHIYFQFRRDIAKLPLLDVKTATEGCLRLLREHGKRLTQLYWILGPLGLVFGYFVGFFRATANAYQAFQDWQFWAVSIPVLALTGWLSTYYARWRYQRAIGRREAELEEILKSLEEAA